MAEKTLREKLEAEVNGLKTERQPFEADYDEIARLALPRASNIQGKRTKVTRRSNTSLHDTGGLLAGRKTTNGMYNGLSSSSRPWFKLSPRDRDQLEFQPVKEWLAIVEQTLYTFFGQTNFYDTAKIQYSDLAHFGVSSNLCLESHEHIAVYFPLEMGTYWLGLDQWNRVDTLARRTTPTVKNLVDMVRDRSKLSEQVVRAYDNGDYSVRVPCMHVIQKNEDSYGQPLSRNIRKPWRSIRWEEGQNDKNVLLSEKGFDSQPFTAPRWEVYGDTAYCDSSPGFHALPDLRNLQLAALRSGRAMDGLVKPPMGVPANLARTGVSIDPGTFTYLEQMATGMTPAPLFTIPYQSIDAIEGKMERINKRVEEIFYADLFMAITDMEGVQPRNEQELLYRNEEKLTQLGPVVDRVNIEKLEADIDRAFTICKNLGLIPPPPPELEGEPLTVDFISILSQAQRAAQNTAIERAARFVGFIAGIFPDAAIKFDAEQAIDEFALNSGTNPRIIRSDEIVAKMKQEMAQKAAAQQAAEMAPAMKQGAEAAKLLSETQVTPDGRTALQNMLGQ